MASPLASGHQSKGCTLEGVRELVEKLRALGATDRELGNALRAAVKEGGKETLTLARGLVPEGSKWHRSYQGRLLAPGYAARHIGGEAYVSRDKQAAKFIVGPEKEAYYASQFVELGVPHYGIEARPWLVPALRRTQPEAIAGIRKVLERRVKSKARRNAKASKR